MDRAVRNVLDAMWRASRKVVVCDFLSTSSEPALRRADLYYADPAEIFRSIWKGWANANSQGPVDAADIERQRESPG